MGEQVRWTGEAGAKLGYNSWDKSYFSIFTFFLFLGEDVEPIARSIYRKIQLICRRQRDQINVGMIYLFDKYACEKLFAVSTTIDAFVTRA